MNLGYADKLKIAERLRERFSAAMRIPSADAILSGKTNIEPVTIPTREGETKAFLFSPPNAASSTPLLIHVRDGGFVRPHNGSDTAFCALAAVQTGIRILDIDYRLAPEHPFPTSFNETYDVAKWAAAHAGSLGIDPAQISLGGRGSGADLAAAIALMANRTGDFAPASQILLCPILDGTTAIAHGGDIPESYYDLYLEDADAIENPFVSPLRATPDMLIGLPPTLILAVPSGSSPMGADRYASMLLAAGVEVQVRHASAERPNDWKAEMEAISEAFSGNWIGTFHETNGKR